MCFYWNNAVFSHKTQRILYVLDIKKTQK